MTTLILTNRNRGQPFSLDNHYFVPVTDWSRGRLRLYAVLKRLHAERPIAVITCQRVYDEAWVVLLFARRHGVRVVGQIHFDIFDENARRENFPGFLFGWLRYKFTLRSLGYFHRLRVVGHGIERTIRARGLNTNVFTSPVLMPMLSSDAEASALGRRQQVVFVGRLIEQKNLPTWLRVCSLIIKARPEVRFVVVGDGPMKEQLQQQAHTLGLGGRLEWRGFVPYQELPALYAESSVFLLTSHYEGFGRVVAEAGSCGCPVVAVNITGVEDIVENRVTGYLEAPGDEVALAARCLELLNDPKLAEEMGSRARVRTRQLFDAETLIRRWVDILLGARLRPLAPQLLPRTRTLHRLRRVLCAKYSVLRNLQYEALQGLVVTGRTLDIGGGRKNSYYHLIRIAGEIDSVNIDPLVEPTIFHDLNQPLPLGDASYDNFVSLNTFEHVQSDQLAIKEAMRILRPGGFFCITVPFLYKVHASPCDFHRHTRQWWSEYLVACGADFDQLNVDPLVWDRLTTAYSFFGVSGVGKAIRGLVGAVAVCKDMMASERNDRLADTTESRRVSEYAVGYFITGRKKQVR